MTTSARITIEVPVGKFGDAYAGQWVERCQYIGKPLIDLWSQFIALFMAGVLTEAALLERGHRVLAQIYTDWNLEGDAGPLPKPWGNPEAFRTLADNDLNLALWVAGLPAKPVIRWQGPQKAIPETGRAVDTRLDGRR